jgi:hypothetical protein
MKVLFAQKQRRGRESRAGAVAALYVANDAGHLHAGFEPGQEGCTEPGGGNDPAENNLYRRCTAGN